jgi:Xaa-Pro aminopeptidase
MLLNRARANAVMDQFGLDGLVAVTNTNVYYLSDYYGPMMQMSQGFTMYAVLPRDEAASPALIMAAPGLYHLEHNPTWMPKVVTFVTQVRPGQDERRDYDSTVEEYIPPVVDTSKPLMPYPMREGAILSSRDEALLARYARHSNTVEASALLALRRALVDAGIEGGTVGFDDPRVLGWLHQVGLKSLKGVDALNIFKRIRMVKTPQEIEYLKISGRNTEAALNAVIDAIEPGLPLADISRIFAMKAAELGGKAEWIIAQMGGLATGVVEPNQIMKLDSVTSYKEYRGDVGRSVVCGVATDEMLMRNRAVMRGLEVAYQNIRPGVSMAEISKLARETVNAEGFPGFVIAAPHSIGLEHTDYPTSIGPELPGTHELIFEENMVFTLDMPYHEFGWGTTHVEDMVIVRADGCEPISSMDTALRVKPIR